MTPRLTPLAGRKDALQGHVGDCLVRRDVMQYELIAPEELKGNSVNFAECSMKVAVEVADAVASCVAAAPLFESAHAQFRIMALDGGLQPGTCLESVDVTCRPMSRRLSCHRDCLSEVALQRTSRSYGNMVPGTW